MATLHLGLTQVRSVLLDLRAKSGALLASLSLAASEADAPSANQPAIDLAWRTTEARACGGAKE